MRTSALATGLAALALSGAALAQQPLSVGGVVARPGEKASGYLEIPAAGDTAPASR